MGIVEELVEIWPNEVCDRLLVYCGPFLQQSMKSQPVNKWAYIPDEVIVMTHVFLITF